MARQEVLMSGVRVDVVWLVVVSIAGTVAGVRSGSTGFVVLFVATGLLAVSQFLRSRSRRAFTLRADLASWLEKVSATTGEPASEVLDRSVSAYRASMRTADHV
jgi:hypothetical protein